MNFKYNKHHQRLQVECPPITYKPLNIDAYRWVFEKGDIRNFQSQYEKFIDNPNPPKRYNDNSDLDLTNRDKIFCEDMAYSMYISEEKAKSGFIPFLKRYKQKSFEMFGKYVAFAQLTEQDGVNGEINDKGHFNHHPFETVNYENRFIIIADLQELWKK
jgi:hypothetical protein